MSQCKQNSDNCAPGCKYSDMNAGLCPLNCADPCFKNCSINYCSPNCLWSDLNNLNCSSECSSDCMNKCINSTDVCGDNQECKYSDMALGLCPLACAGSCFANCSKKYCSAGCLLIDINYTNCSNSCSSECEAICLNATRSYSSENLGWLWIIIIGILITFAIIM